MNQTISKDKSEFTIGLFDSGVGGLSVLRQLEKICQHLPWASSYRFIYLGDTARCPYGNRPAEEISAFVRQIADWLIEKGADTIVMSCNTSAALAGSFARLRSAVPVFDLISPTADFVAEKGMNVAVLATASTVKSQAFRHAIHARNASLQVTEIACPDLVPIIEKGLIKDKTTRQVLKRYIQEINGNEVQGLVLGCTHFPFLSELISDLLPSGTALIDPAEQLVKSLLSTERSMEYRQSFSPENSPGKSFYVTGSAAAFAQIAEICLGHPIGTVYGITVDELEKVGATAPLPSLVSGSHLETAEAGG